MNCFSLKEWINEIQRNELLAIAAFRGGFGGGGGGGGSDDEDGSVCGKVVRYCGDLRLFRLACNPS